MNDQVVEPGTMVLLSYVVIDVETGDEVDRVEVDQPVSLVVGRGRLMPVIERGLIGARRGETRSIDVEVDHPVFRRRLSFVVTVHDISFPPEGERDDACRTCDRQTRDGSHRCCRVTSGESQDPPD